MWRSHRRVVRIIFKMNRKELRSKMLDNVIQRHDYDLRQNTDKHQNELNRLFKFDLSLTVVGILSLMTIF